LKWNKLNVQEEGNLRKRKHPSKKANCVTKGSQQSPPLHEMRPTSKVRTAKRKRTTSQRGRAEEAALVLTIGHSTRTVADFIRLVQAHGVTCVLDVRTIPRSRHNPQFNQQALRKSLEKAGLGYIHLAGLGGLRHSSASSSNTGWRNASFRGFADYMQTPEFEHALDAVVKLASAQRLALMCAEAVPWRCHRSLIADALLVHGIPVEHIMSPTNRKPHTLTRFAKVQDFRVTYPGPPCGKYLKAPPQ
jgi:hypothetical protein